MRIDAHQHFWTVSRTDYGWLTPELPTLYKDFLPADLEPMLIDHAIDGTVLVQAAPTVAETEYLLSLADQSDFIKGVVGWVDFESPNAATDLARLNRHPKFVGVRPMVQDIADVNWLLRPDLGPAFASIMEHNLTFDALTKPLHLENLRALLVRLPEMRTVIDHGSKPYIKDGIMAGWAQHMTALAAETEAYCKLSGLTTEASPEWSVADLKPYVDHLLECFGPGRLIWGSDWPVCELACTYERWVETSEQLLVGLTQSERDQIFGGNALRAYQI